MMTRKEFVALADAIRKHNAVDTHIHGGHVCRFTDDELNTLADFCQSMNQNFDRKRWMDYIKAETKEKLKEGKNDKRRVEG